MEKKVKKSLICKSISHYRANGEICSVHQPQAGDVGIFRVLSETTASIRNEQGIPTKIFQGDHLMLTFGNRYATNQVEGYVPEGPTLVCQLLGRGGVAGILKNQNEIFRRLPVDLELVGYACDPASGKVLNTIRQEKLVSFDDPSGIRSKVVLSIGSAMDSGKTTSAAYLCKGLSQVGKRVAYIKLTGTVFPKDAQLARDLGADYAIDFSYFGFPSTYMCSEQTLLDLYQSLLDQAWKAVEADYVVLEIADGLLQRETKMLLQNQVFMDTVHSVMLSCGDSLGVLSGLQLLEKWGCVPFTVTGLFTASELLVREVKDVVGTPILNLKELSNCRGVELLEQLTTPGKPHWLHTGQEAELRRAA